MGSCLSRSKKEKTVDDHKAVKEDVEKKVENELVVINEKVEGKAKDDTQKSLPKTDVKNVETDAEQVEKNDDTKMQRQNENAKEN